MNEKVSRIESIEHANFDDKKGEPFQFIHQQTGKKSSRKCTLEVLLFVLRFVLFAGHSYSSIQRNE